MRGSGAWRWPFFYLLVAVLVTAPVWASPTAFVMAQPSPDQMDTLLLRWLVGQGLEGGYSDHIYFPDGYPLAALIPNWADHYLALPFWRLLGFPLGQNVFLTLVLALNGLAAHLLGKDAGGSDAAGLLCGVAFATSPAVLRELDLGHEPQTMVMMMLLYVLALRRTLDGVRGAWVAMGLTMALAGLVYWYQALFLCAVSVPVVLASLREGDVGGRLARVGLAALVAAAVVGWPLFDALDPAKGLAWRTEADLPRIPQLAMLPAAHQFPTAQAPDLLWWLLPGLEDRSSRVPWVLLLAAVLGHRRHPHPWRWWAAATLGGLLLMGPYLKLGSEPVLLGGQPIPLPGWLLAESSSLFARLTWPARWAVVVPLALLPLAARAPRPLWLAGLLLVETVLLSRHLPIGRTPVAHVAGWSVLAEAPGAVLTVPPDWTGERGPHLGLLAPPLGQPLAAAILVSASSPQPEGWARWQGELALWDAVYDRKVETEPAQQLREAGIAAVALDATPGGTWLASELVQWTEALDEALAQPGVDYGPVVVWWLDPPASGVPPALPDAAAWRQRWREELDEEQGPDRPGEGFRPYRWRTQQGRGAFQKR